MILWEAFLPDERTAARRADGGSETSVNWEDTESVADLTRRQPGSSMGVARLSLAEIRRIARGPNVKDALLAERKIDDVANPHHGNLVFPKGMPKVQMKMIANALALESVFVPKSTPPK